MLIAALHQKRHDLALHLQLGLHPGESGLPLHRQQLGFGFG